MDVKSEERAKRRVAKKNQKKRGVVGHADDKVNNLGKESNPSILHIQKSYMELFDSAKDIIMIADLWGNILDISQSVAQYGFERDKMIGSTYLDIVPKKDRDQLRKNLSQLRKGKMTHGVTEVITPKGSIFMEFQSTPIREGAKIVAFLSILRDVTQAKEQEEALKKSEERYKNLFESFGGGVIAADTKGTITDVNQRVIEYSGYEREDLIGKNFLKFIPKKNLPFVLKQQIKLRTGTSFIDGEIELKTPLRGNLLLDYVATAIRDRGKITGFMIVLRDVSEAKKAQEEVRKSEAKYKNLFESTGGGVILINNRGVIQDVNHRLLKHMGFKREDIVGKNFLKFVPKKRWPFILAEQLRLRRSNTGSIYGETTVLTPKGEIVCTYSAGRVKEDGKMTGIIIGLNDITDKKRAEEAQIRSEEKYKELFDNAGDTIIICDLKGKITDVNKTVESFGFKKEDVIGRNFLSFAPKKDWPQLSKKVLNLWRDKTIQGETEIVTPHGKEFADYSARPIKEGGKIVGFTGILRNITDKVMTSEALKKSEERYRNLFETAGDAILVADRKGKILEVNQAMNNYGFKKENMIGKNFLTFVAKKDWPFLTKDVLNLWRGKNTHGELEAITPFGPKNVEFNSTPLRENNKVVGFLTILRDITDRKLASQEIVEREERYRHLFDNARDPTVIMDLRGKILDVNNAIVDYGFTRGDIVGKNALDFIAKKDWPKIIKDFSLNAFGKETEGEFEIKTPKKGNRLALYHARPIRKGGKIIANQTTLQDITERRRAERAIMESEKRYRFLVNNSNELIMVLDIKGKILFANKTALDIIEADRESVIGTFIFKFLPKEAYKQVFDAIMGEFFGKHHGRMEIPVITTTGKMKYLEFAPGSTPVFRGGRVIGILVNAIDVTYRKQAEKERLELYRMKELDKIKDDLFSMTAHELKTPLTPIKLESDMWLAGIYGRMDLKQKKSLKSIERNTERLIHLIEDIMTITKIEQEKLKYEFEKFKMNNLLSDIGSDMIAEAQEKDIYLKTNIPKEPVYVMGDKTRITQVIANLITNSIKFTDKGGITVSMVVINGTVQVSVKDTGWGVSEIDKPHIFEKYFKSQTHSIGKGLGLGLPISKGIIERHGGKMWFESEEGKGTTFYFTIPLYKGNK